MFLRASDEYAAGKARIPGPFLTDNTFGDIRHLLSRKEGAWLVPAFADEEFLPTVLSAVPVPLRP